MPDSRKTKKDRDLKPLIIVGGIALLFALLKGGKGSSGSLSKYYGIAELEHSNTAKEENINNVANSKVIANASLLAKTILDPLTDYLGYRPWHDGNSWYRSPELNARIGGSKYSDHMTGRAIDLDTLTGNNPDIVRAILQLGLPFDQMILEYGDLEDPTHVHISLRSEGNRREIRSTSDGENYPIHDEQDIWILYGL